MRTTGLLLLLSLLFTAKVDAADCQNWIARVISIQGQVDVRRQGQSGWMQVVLNKQYCVGDVIRVQAGSRAGLELHNETILRLNQNSTLLLSGPKKEVSWLDLIKGSLHAITRVPRSLEIKTPFVNAAVEGTEFHVSVRDDNTVVGVIEGLVMVANEFGRLQLAKQQTAITYKDKAPVLRLDIKPADSVQWSLFYPRLNVMELSQAEELLFAGQVEAANKILYGQASADALSLRSIIAIASNNKQQGLKLARQALQVDVSSVAAQLALSYALQAGFDLRAALDAAQRAVASNHRHAIAWSRLAELHLSLGEINEGLAAADMAVEIDPKLARTHAVLGFAHLLLYNKQQAGASFATAIRLDSSEPLARLGSGLAAISKGALQQGRREIEIAASLDTNNSLIRSYLGKAYLEENRNQLAAEQFSLAKQMDPNDPTPWLYNGLRKQSENNPVGALQEMQQSIRLNNNRAIYRSRLQLDADLATRGSGLGRIYQELGFGQLALNEANKSLSNKQSNYSAHRLLADAYLTRTRHEVARVSELLQAQMLQPINTTPIQPQMSESTLSLLNNLGVSNAALNEYDSLFLRNRLKLSTTTLLAGQDTLAGELVASAVHDNFSISAGRYSYETDGFHANNDDDLNLENYFMQYAATEHTGFLLEAVEKQREYGDLLRLDANNFQPNLNNIIDSSYRRFGVNQKINSSSRLLLTVMREAREVTEFNGAGVTRTRLQESIKADSKELRYLLEGENGQLTAGYSFNKSSNVRRRYTAFMNSTQSGSQRNSGAYLYGYLQQQDIHLTLGLSRDHYRSNLGVGRDQTLISKKFGLQAQLTADTRFSMAYFESYRRPILNNQTLEPTTIAGFNQFYDDRVGTTANNYAARLDVSVNPDFKIGFEAIERNMSVPFATMIGSVPMGGQAPWSRQDIGIYAYWLPRKDMSVSLSLIQDKFERDPSVPGVTLLNSKIQRMPLGINWFHPAGWVIRSQLQYVRQNGTFRTVGGGAPSARNDSFFIVDASLEYRFRRAQGGVTVGVLNLFDERFNYQDADINRQELAPERMAYVRISMGF